MRINFRPSPFYYPIVFFGLTILVGTVLLHLDYSTQHDPLPWIDALFTATSATCVTGLIVVDTGSFFTPFGQIVILLLIQVGGLGIMTLTGLVFYLWHRRVSLTDRVAVGQSLLHDPRFHLGKFMLRVVAWTLAIEAAGVTLILLRSQGAFTPFAALFHSVSAFCNAGFSLYNSSLSAWRGRWDINLIFIALITVGGIGFSVLMELQQWAAGRWRQKRTAARSVRLSWYSRVVLKSSLVLVLGGWVCIGLAEFVHQPGQMPPGDAVVTALFQSVTCRTAGFNTIEIGQLTNLTLLIMLFLMVIGGAPGSCAGGIKVTTFRAGAAFLVAQFKGSQQAEVGNYALDNSTINKALILIVFALVIIVTGVFLLHVTESANPALPMQRGTSLEILFEVVSAFATVGLSTGLTPKLSFGGRCVIIALMFIGRLGPILFLSAIQSMQKPRRYLKPEKTMLVG